jgi:hypothetical protein
MAKLYILDKFKNVVPVNPHLFRMGVKMGVGRVEADS